MRNIHFFILLFKIENNIKKQYKEIGVFPKRYTFQEVQSIFAEKNCILQSASYTN
jgi:hypothetical protein